MPICCRGYKARTRGACAGRVCVGRARARAAQARAAFAACGWAGAVLTAQQHLVLKKAVEAVEEKDDDFGELEAAGLRVARLDAGARGGDVVAVHLRQRFGVEGGGWVRNHCLRLLICSCMVLVMSTLSGGLHGGILSGTVRVLRC